MWKDKIRPTGTGIRTETYGSNGRYEFVRTVVGEGGNVRHIFGKVTNEKLGQRLANTGTTETNTGLAGLGLAILGGLLAVAHRKNDKN